MTEKISLNAPDGTTASAEKRALELGITKGNKKPHLGNYIVKLMQDDAKKGKRK